MPPLHAIENGNRNELHDTHSFGDAYDIAFKAIVYT